MKLTTARAAVSVASETVEAFGGAGYVEDTGGPALLRDAQVLSIWEGTTNVLSLDALRTALKDADALAPLRDEVENCAHDVNDGRLAGVAGAALDAVSHADTWLAATAREGQTKLEAGARRFALTLGRALSLALLARHAQWSLDEEQDSRASAAARRFALHGVDLINDADPEDSALLMEDR